MGPKRSLHIFRGKFKKFLFANFTLPCKTNNQCRVGHILFCFTLNSELFIETVKQVKEYFGFSISKNDIQTLVNKAKKWVYNFKRDSKHFITFCNETYAFQKPLLTNSLQANSNSVNLV